MSKIKLSKLYLLILASINQEPKSILEIARNSKTSWEATKNCIEVLCNLGLITKSFKKKSIRAKYILKTCEWTYDEDNNCNYTICGNTDIHKLVFEVGTVKENEYKYCPYCGGNIKIIVPQTKKKVGK